MEGTIGVHATHCCKWHGCKYGDPDCPVVSGEVKQQYLCWDCDNDLKNEEYYRNKISKIEEIKKFEKGKI